jgi:hypothetical protein
MSIVDASQPRLSRPRHSNGRRDDGRRATTLVRGAAFVFLLACVWTSGCADDGSPPLRDTEAATSEAASTDGSSSASTGSDALEVAHEVVTHAQQPMVVDITLTSSRPASFELEHVTDAGVIIRPLDAPSPTAATFRVRGLTPAALHGVTYTATAADATVSGSIEFSTGSPLPGYMARFAVEGGPGDALAPYRMFDVMPFPGLNVAGLFVVDTDGTTRWHLGDLTGGLGGPADVWAAAKLRGDGTFFYLQRHEFRHRDELGIDLARFTWEELGVEGLHHEVIELDSGNFMAIGNSWRTIDYPVEGELYVAGDVVVEFTPEGDAVWVWDTFDHLDPLRVRTGFDNPMVHPETGRIAKDWTHANGIEYDEATKTFLLSFRHQDWILRIDHATGDILWRLGDEGDFELVGGERWFFSPHSPQWQADGSLVLYDNGVDNPYLDDELEVSRIVRYAIDETTMTATEVWEDQSEPFMSAIGGDVDRLPGGRLLALDSAVQTETGILGRLRELDEATPAEAQWTLSTPIGFFVYRATAHDRLPGLTAN